MTLRGEHISLLLRIGVAFAFLYPAVSAVFVPDAWIGYFPPFLLDLFSGREGLLLHAFGVSEAIIGLWILSGRNIFIPSALATLYLVAIVLVNFSQLDIVFRDISIALMALTLVLSSRKQGVVIEESVTVVTTR
jgi:hypothetical protein